MKYFQEYLILLVASASFLTAEACDGYKLKFNMKPLKDDNCVVMDKLKVDLTKDCFAAVQGCVTIKNDIKTCQVEYNIKRENFMVPIKGERNMCEELEKAAKDPEAQKKFKESNIKASCPLPKMDNTCAPPGSKTSVAEYKDKFKLGSGKYNGTITLKCDACDSLFQVDVTFKKGK